MCDNDKSIIFSSWSYDNDDDDFDPHLNDSIRFDSFRFPVYSLRRAIGPSHNRTYRQISADSRALCVLVFFVRSIVSVVPSIDRAVK